MLGFHAEYAGGDIVCQAGEIADAQWFYQRQHAANSAKDGYFRLVNRRISANRRLIYRLCLTAAKCGEELEDAD